MTRNMGTADRVARVVVIAPLAIVLAALTGFASAFGVILLAVAAIMLSTGVVGFCPLYAPFRFSTVPSRRAHV